MRRQDLTAVCFAMTLLQGCKPQASSDTKSLDALAGVEKVKSSCSGENVTPFDLPGELGQRAKAQIIFPKEVEAEVKKAFTAVPEGLSRAILLLGYEIEYSKDPAAACKGVRQGALTQATGCAKTSKVATPSGDGEKVRLIMSADPKAIAHSTLLGVASLVANKLGKLSVQDGALVVRDLDDAKMTEFKRGFATAVLHDAALRGRKLVQLEALLPKDTALTAANTSLDQRRDLWNAYRAAQPDASEAAELSILANGADSLYCSRETQAALDSWPTARDLWKKTMAPDIEALKNLGPQTANANPPKYEGESLGLWGRWGAGNGPLRQMFSNRIEDTGYAFPRAHGLRRGWDGSGNWYQPPAWGDGRIGWRFEGTGTPVNGGGYYEDNSGFY